MSAGEAYSSGRWLTPPRQGINSIAVGATCPIDTNARSNFSNVQPLAVMWFFDMKPSSVHWWLCFVDISCHDELSLSTCRHAASAATSRGGPKRRTGAGLCSIGCLLYAEGPALEQSCTICLCSMDWTLELLHTLERHCAP